MTITDGQIEAGLTPLPVPTTGDSATIYELGGLRLRGAGDAGLDDLGENEGQEDEAAGDGRSPLELAMSPRAIELTVSVVAKPDPAISDPSDEDVAEAFAASLHEIKKVMALLPHRQGERLLRWRRLGEPARRLMVQPALGRSLQLIGNIDGAEGKVDRQVLWNMVAKLRLTAADPIITSDLHHGAVFTAGQTQTIHNAGVLAAVQPTNWWLEAPAGTVIENLDTGEYVNFPAGPVTVGRDRLISGPDGTYGQCSGRAGAFFPQWPVLYPGDNHIKATKACTLYWRDT